MKKKILVILLITIMYIIPKASFAKSEDKTSEIAIENQEKKFGVQSFLSEAEEYTEDIDIKDIFKSSMSGKLDENKILKYIYKLLGNNLKEAIKTVSVIIVIVIIHSILKSISENLGNESVAKITYYIQYILIVTLVMRNFGEIIIEVKTAVQDLSRFYKYSNTATYDSNDSNRKCSNIKYDRTNININNNIYRKLHK